MVTEGIRSVTHGNEEKHTGNHRSERCPTHLPRIDVPEEPSRERTDGRNNIGAIEDVVIGYFIRCECGT